MADPLLKTILAAWAAGLRTISPPAYNHTVDEVYEWGENPLDQGARKFVTFSEITEDATGYSATREFGGGASPPVRVTADIKLVIGVRNEEADPYDAMLLATDVEQKTFGTDAGRWIDASVVEVLRRGAAYPRVDQTGEYQLAVVDYRIVYGHRLGDPAVVA